MKHEANADYYTVPRLLANANQTSMLQGQKRLTKLQWYLEDHPTVSFVVLNTYDCVQYHEDIADCFQRSHMPAGMNEDIIVQVRPYFSRLIEDAKEAERIDQVLIPSKALLRAVQAIEVHYPTEMRDWLRNLTHPYPQLWHCKSLLQKTAASSLGSTNRIHVEALLNHLVESVGSAWEEAEMLSRNGFVEEQHWAKIFRPNEPIVSMTEGEPRAYMLTRCPKVESDGLVLYCWSWEFDGEFFQKNFQFRVDWPDQIEDVKITTLPYYPLRFGSTQLADRLELRGRNFWSCRRRRYVSYDMPRDHRSSQAVRQTGIIL